MDSKLLNSGTPHRAAGSSYLCRCPWWLRGWRRSCTPAPWCGRRAASGCSPRSAAWRRPCSSRSRPAPAPRPGRTAARRPDTGRRRGTESREPAGRAEGSGERRHRRAVIPSPPVKPRGRHLPGGPDRAGRPPARGELLRSPCLSGAERESGVRDAIAKRGRRGLRQRRARPPFMGRGAAACASALTSRVPGRGRVQRSRHPRNAAGARRGRSAPPRLPAPRPLAAALPRGVTAPALSGHRAALRG